jgi:hypothetical protein
MTCAMHDLAWWGVRTAAAGWTVNGCVNFVKVVTSQVGYAKVVVGDKGLQLLLLLLLLLLCEAAAASCRRGCIHSNRQPGNRRCRCNAATAASERP